MAIVSGLKCTNKTVCGGKTWDPMDRNASASQVRTGVLHPPRSETYPPNSAMAHREITHKISQSLDSGQGHGIVDRGTHATERSMAF